jgi:hypothetical protein
MLRNMMVHICTLLLALCGTRGLLSEATTEFKSMVLVYFFVYVYWVITELLGGHDNHFHRGE